MYKRQDGSIISIYKVQIKMSISQLNCTAHDQLEDCPQTNSDKQNSKQPTAVWLGEQVKMNVLCLSGIGNDTVGTAHNGSTERTGEMCIRDRRMDKKPDRSEIIAMTLLFALTLVLTVLKVTRTVSLTWLWVLGPLWIGTRRYRD